MEVIVLSIHLLVCICLIGLVLLQRSEGGALGMGGGGGALVSGRGAADALARMTFIAGGFFLVTSFGLTVLSGAAASSEGRSVIDTAPIQRPATVPAPAAPAPDANRPDPTQSSAPEAAETQLAAIGPAQAAAAPNEVAPAPTAAATRAGPIEPPRSSPSTPTVQRTAPSSASPPRTQPASTTTTRTQQPTTRTPTTTIRSTGATTPPSTQPARTNTTSAVNGVNLTEPAEPESVDLGNGLEAVRRERAGPDQ